MEPGCLPTMSTPLETGNGHQNNAARSMQPDRCNQNNATRSMQP